MGAIIEAKKHFNYVIDNYPNSDFALDAKYKIDLIEDFLASKEMYLGNITLKGKNGYLQLTVLKL